VTLKYDRTAQVLSVAVCWREILFQDFREKLLPLPRAPASLAPVEKTASKCPEERQREEIVERQTQTWEQWSYQPEVLTHSRDRKTPRRYDDYTT
jgi:hypothetical protein